MSTGAAVPARACFGETLRGPATRALRRRLARVLRGVGAPVMVETFFVLYDALHRMTPDALPRATTRHLVILDLQRMVVFRDSGTAGQPGPSSLVRFLVDGYPWQPFLRLAAAERNRPYRFSFDPAVLDSSARCLMELAPGEYGVVDFLTGEVALCRLHLHPHAAPPRLIAAREPARVSPLRAVSTDRRLRSCPPPDLTGLIGEAAGVIRRDHVGPNVASMAAGITVVSWNRGARKEVCGARSFSAADARSVARCEAVERFQVARQPPSMELVRGSYRELAEYAVDPRQLFFGRSPECPNDRGIPYDPDLPISWTWAWGPAERRWRLVPAQDVWFDTARVMSEPRFVRATTSGCAVGATFEEACLAAALEAVERDAFLTSWYLRRPAVEIDLDSFRTDAVHDLLGRFRLTFAGYRPVLVDLTSDVGIPTIAALALRHHGDGAPIHVAAAADADPEGAASRALRDLIGFRPVLSAERRVELRRRLTDPESIVGIDGHWELYYLDESFGAFSYLELGRRHPIAVQDIGRQSPIPGDAELRLDLVLEAFDRRLHEIGAAMYLKDLTHPGLAEYGLRTARAIMPGLYPIWFGGLERRFAVTDRLRRLAQMYTGEPLQPDRLQLAPHPMH